MTRVKSTVGELRTRITLESSSVVKGAGGAQTKTYTSKGSVWAKWTNAFGQEAITDGALQGLKRATVRIRYRSDVTASWAVVKDGERYEIIVPPDNIQDRDEFLEFQVQLLKASA
jgi:SPP1 family predicted phage head-tail adaptor